MRKFLGALIRRERLRRNFSQEGLCRGVCAVSYLSKIEQGKVEAGEDILLPLLRRLGVDYETDPAFLARAEEAVETAYRELLSGRESLDAFQGARTWLEENRERCLRSPYLLDVLLLLSLRQTLAPELEEFAAVMDRRQYALYLVLRLENGEEKNEEESVREELLRLDGSAFYTIFVGELCLWRGNYAQAADLLARGYDLAAREGHAYLMTHAKLLLGNGYSATGHRDLMLSCYQVTRNLAACLREDRWSAYIDYNTAASYLEWGMDREALELLTAAPLETDPLYFHKLAIAYERLGRPEEAMAALERGYALLDGPGGPPLEDTEEWLTSGRELLDLVRYRLEHPDYLGDGTYAGMMSRAFARLQAHMGDGFVRFHVPYMLEVLEAERRYKDAYQLTKKYFYNRD